MNKKEFNDNEEKQIKYQHSTISLSHMFDSVFIYVPKVNIAKETVL